MCGGGYGPNEGDGEERDRFWNDIGKTLDSVWNGYRLCILGDINGWIEDRTRPGITGAFGVPGENDNGRRVVEFLTERGLFALVHKSGEGARPSGSKEHDRSSADEQGYVLGICRDTRDEQGYAGCAGGDRDVKSD